jgi:hypothetical protein
MRSSANNQPIAVRGVRIAARRRRNDADPTRNLGASSKASASGSRNESCGNGVFGWENER